MDLYEKYCEDCQHLETKDINGIPFYKCLSVENRIYKKTFLRIIEYKLEPKDINGNNNCKWFSLRG